MRLTRATIYALAIPFVEAFRHSAAARGASDSIVVRVRDERGTEGFGEGAPRPYVTGETVEAAVAHLADTLWPAIVERPLPVGEAVDLGALDRLVPDLPLPGARAAHASRSALELAVLDCALRRQERSLGDLVPPRRTRVVYSGVITAGPLEVALRHARQMRLVGLRQIKLKVGFADDVTRVRAIREALGPEVSLRLDANGAWDVERALTVLEAVAPLGLAAVEEPLAPPAFQALAGLRTASPVPIMLDESVVTLADLEAAIAAKATDYVNVRVSKCGGFGRARALASRAAAHGLGIQVGSQVGETAILAAAGRHLAAGLDEVGFVEGSFGTLLLAEDVSADGVRFGRGGEAPLLRGPGLGVRVLEERLRRHARAIVELDEAGRSGGIR